MSEQATAAAEKIDKMVAGMILASMTGGPVSGSREKIAAIIDAAFAGVFALLKESRGTHRLTLRMAETRDPGEYHKANAAIKAIHEKIDALIGKDES